MYAPSELTFENYIDPRSCSTVQQLKFSQNATKLDLEIKVRKTKFKIYLPIKLTFVDCVDQRPCSTVQNIRMEPNLMSKRKKSKRTKSDKTMVYHNSYVHESHRHNSRRIRDYIHKHRWILSTLSSLV